MNGPLTAADDTPVALIVDDREVNRIVTARVVATCVPRWDPVQLAGGAEALRWCWQRLADEASLPGVMLLDLHMPGMDGYEVLRQLRAAPELTDIPVVVVSASADPDAEQHVRLLGAQAFVPKPFDVPTLRALLGRLRQSHT